MEQPKRRVDICSPNKEIVVAVEKQICWKLCCIFQLEGNDSLQSPFGNPTQGVTMKERYEQLGANILKLHNIDQLPLQMDTKS